MRQLIPNESPFFIGGIPEQMPDWRELFGGNGAFALDIGSGIGDFTAQMAARHPETCFIAIDYYNKGCIKTCARAERLGLSNIRVVRGEIREFLSRCIPSGFLSQVFINCPDPWPKQRHRKRRLVNAEFLGWLHGFMVPDGEVVFATDFDDYGLDVAREFPSVPGYSNMLAPDLYRHELDGYPRSKYMLKFLKEGKRIYYVKYAVLPGKGGQE